MLVKIGSAELTEESVKALYEDKKYICTYKGVYQLFYSKNTGYYGKLVIYSKNLAKRGRFYALSAREVNNVLGKEILRTDIY